jgi:hypothetical protein
MRFCHGRIMTALAPLLVVAACGDTSGSGGRDAATETEGSDTGAKAGDSAPGDTSVVSTAEAGETGAGPQDSGTTLDADASGGGNDAGKEAGRDAAADGGGKVPDASSSVGDGAVGATDASGVSADGSVAIPAPSSFHCVNWADQRDNFVNGLLQTSGLDSTTDTYATVQTKANAILSGFEGTLGANAIRVPINEPTVMGPWWSAYKGLIDAAVAKGMKVVIAYWAFHNGKPDSTPAFTAMWQVVVDEYASNNLVFFDIHNEPFGFSTADWVTFAAAWIANFPGVPRSRVIVAGSGYDQNVTAVAANSQFDGCLFSLHVYTFFSTTVTTVAGWQSLISSSLGVYAPRTIVTEWGAPMTTGVTYNATGTGSTDQAYMAGTPGEIRTLGIGSCYWPGLRIGDAWSITTLNGTGANATLSVNNASGVDRIHFAWGL